VYALADVDAMYCSVERVFQPQLRTCPLVVLSNNDGCVIARSAEAKQLGIIMGQPWFQVRRQWPGVAVRSANYALYGDFSARLLALASQHTPHVEPYSIDECFLALPAGQAAQAARQLRDQAARWLGLPVSVGIAATKTLAKLATTQAKATGQGVCDLTRATPAALAALLARTPVTGIWGIGYRLAARLRGHAISTAAELAAADPRWARRAFSVNLERTIRELRGTPCIPLAAQPPPRRQMMHCRQLGQPLTRAEDVAAAAAGFGQALAARMRRRGLAAGTLSVWLSSGGDFYRGPRIDVQAVQALLVPAATAGIFAATAAALARRMWRPGYTYRRVGALALDLIPARQAAGLWGSTQAGDAVCAAIDAIITRYGPGSIGLGQAGIKQPPPWATHQHHLSPAFTTRWDQLATTWLTTATDILMQQGRSSAG
jgi:DNA polymerase V